MTTTESHVQGVTLSLLPENPMILPSETTKHLQQPTNNPGGNPQLIIQEEDPHPGEIQGEILKEVVEEEAEVVEAEVKEVVETPLLQQHSKQFKYRSQSI